MNPSVLSDKKKPNWKLIALKISLAIRVELIVIRAKDLWT